MSVDQRIWWERGDDARLEDERAGNVAADATAEQLRVGLDLAAWFEVDLAELSDAERVAALAAAEHGYVEGRTGGYGQPSWLDAHAGSREEGVRMAMATWTYEGYWATVLGATRTAEMVVVDFDLSPADRRGLDEWLGTAEVEAWRVGGLGGELPAEWAGHHATALAELAEVQS